MATNLIQDGASLTFVADAAITGGQLAFVGSIFGVAEHDAAIGENYTITTGKVWALPKTSADTPTIGAPAYWDATAEEVTTVSTDNTKIGVFMDALGAGTTSANIRLNSSF